MNLILVSAFDLSFAINCFSTVEKSGFPVEVDGRFGRTGDSETLPVGDDDNDIVPD